LCWVYASFIIGHGAGQRFNDGTEHSTTELNDHHHRVGFKASILCELLKYDCPIDRLCQKFPSINSQAVHQYFIFFGWASINVDAALKYVFVYDPYAVFLELA
jgi:hypothetical protein